MEEYSLAGNSSDDAKSTACPRGHWRPAEDDKLRQLVEQYGAQNWNSIAEKLQGRSGKLYAILKLFFDKSGEYH
jgi:myb proto-oncogene protein